MFIIVVRKHMRLGMHLSLRVQLCSVEKCRYFYQTRCSCSFNLTYWALHLMENGYSLSSW